MSLVSEGKKRQVLPLPQGLVPGLWVVATPIGNLADISDRARQALAWASRVLCEDTRRTAQLLQALGIQRQEGGHFELERTDAYATPERLKAVLRWLKEGESLALVTDAGTPAISDPGAHLVRLAHEQGVCVTPIPGPSAVPALLSVSGFGETAFSFHGFFPRKNSERIEAVQGLLEVSAKSGTRVHIWFESPQRIEEALQALQEGLGDLASLTQVCAAKELTKAYEKIFTGSAPEVLAQIRGHVATEGEKGEWSFAILLPPQESLQSVSEESSDWVKALYCMIDKTDGDSPITASEAARRVSQYFGTPKKLAYEKALRISGKKS
jgi:16S rRNA (cytidine1402-2'-O)-methyltransferase